MSVNSASATTIVNGWHVYMPVVMQQYDPQEVCQPQTETLGSIPGVLWAHPSAKPQG
jgi:hypothetical protein